MYRHVYILVWLQLEISLMKYAYSIIFSWGFFLGHFSQGKVIAFPGYSLVLAFVLAIGSGDGSFISLPNDERVAEIPWAISHLRSFCDDFRRGRTTVASTIGDFRHGRKVIASAISDFEHRRAAASSPLGMGRPLGQEMVAATLRLVLGSLLLYDPIANQA
ncbi:hypothetical protein B296_00012728 [Ensete ventricosum]|uniref:Uncharacterized protein n=1 Tax=Ensete ventricosum TaxID=4639 RepID=A0A426ZL01_ENSVE|nr:hypothetical protein B296_00012728 [Ensete ventricosum]